MKNVIITGASRGLGFEITKQELEKGNFVFATYRTINDNLLVLEQNYNNLKLIEMDITNDISIKNAANKIRCFVNKIDIIYNNAGVLNKSHKTNFKDLIFNNSVLDVINTNAIGFLRIIQNFYDILNKNSMIIVISSGAGSIQLAFENNYDINSVNIPYYISKASLNICACLLKSNLEKNGIKILLIDPGRIKTAMGGKNAQIEVFDSAKNIISFAHKERIPKSFFIDFNGNEIKL